MDATSGYSPEAEEVSEEEITQRSGDSRTGVVYVGGEEAAHDYIQEQQDEDQQQQQQQELRESFEGSVGSSEMSGDTVIYRPPEGGAGAV